MDDELSWETAVSLASLVADRFDPPQLWLAWLLKCEAPELDDDDFLEYLTRKRETPFYREDVEFLRRSIERWKDHALKLEGARAAIAAGGTS